MTNEYGTRKDGRVYRKAGSVEAEVARRLAGFDAQEHADYLATVYANLGELRTADAIDEYMRDIANDPDISPDELAKLHVYADERLGRVE